MLLYNPNKMRSQEANVTIAAYARVSRGRGGGGRHAEAPPGE